MEVDREPITNGPGPPGVDAHGAGSVKEAGEIRSVLAVEKPVAGTQGMAHLAVSSWALDAFCNSGRPNSWAHALRQTPRPSR